MALIEAVNVYVGFAGTPVLIGAGATIQEGEKVGLIGANGSGKTTLVRTLIGLQEIDSGAIRLDRPKETRISYVPQYFPEDARGNTREFLVHEVLQIRSGLRKLEHEMTSSTDRDLARDLTRVLDEYGRLRERYDQQDGDTAEERANAVLSRVGLERSTGTNVTHLSGGEKNRLQIARALMERPDLLILDEPGNHLDAWGLDWLEKLLVRYPAAVLIISHNRYLLDRVVTRILELRDGTITSWAGNYSAYRSTRLREAVRQARDARADQKKLNRLKEMVRKLAELSRVRADPAIGQRLRARRTQLKWARREPFPEAK